MSQSGPGSTPGSSAAQSPGTSGSRTVRRASFRLPAWALILPAVAFVCAVPLATAGGALTWVAYAIPVLVLLSTVLTRTTADARRIRVIGPWRRRTIAWADLDRLEFTGTRWAVAVTNTGRRVRLVMVRPRDLPVLTAVAGGDLLLAEDQGPAQDDTDGPDPSAAVGPTPPPRDDDPTPDPVAADRPDVSPPAEPAPADPAPVEPTPVEPAVDGARVDRP